MKSNETIIRPFVPTKGEIYTNKGSGIFRCECVYSDERACMVNTTSGWELTAHNIQKCSDGTIEWDYSTDGHWTR